MDYVEWTPLKAITEISRQAGCTENDMEILYDTLDELRHSTAFTQGSVEQGIGYAASKIKSKLPKDRQVASPSIPAGRDPLDHGSPFVVPERPRVVSDGGGYIEGSLSSAIARRRAQKHTH